jgi:hypothetical protein
VDQNQAALTTEGFQTASPSPFASTPSLSDGVCDRFHDAFHSSCASYSESLLGIFQLFSSYRMFSQMSHTEEPRMMNLYPAYPVILSAHSGFFQAHSTLLQGVSWKIKGFRCAFHIYCLL